MELNFSLQLEFPDIACIICYMSEYRVMVSEDLKQERIDAANTFIQKFSSYGEKIRNSEIRSLLEQTSRNIRDLRDVQYLFDSGEKQLVTLYTRYLPYLATILEEYVLIENSGNYDASVKGAHKLSDTLTLLNRTIREITRLLPEDEIDEANAQAKAEKIKEMLNAVSRSTGFDLDQEM